MPAIVRWFVAVPFAALVTVFLFALIYNQIAPRPFIYRSAEDPNEIKIDISAFEEDWVIICSCHIWLPVPVENSNSWTRSDKAVSEAPRVADKKPEAAIEYGAIGGGLHYCNGGSPHFEFISVPEFPRACIAKGAEGSVVVRFDITREGKVVNARIVESTDRCFNSSVIDAVSRRRYPTVCDANGKPQPRPGQQEAFTFAIEE